VPGFVLAFLWWVVVVCECYWISATATNNGMEAVVCVSWPTSGGRGGLETELPLPKAGRKGTG
jgi:hypothetical protein